VNGISIQEAGIPTQGGVDALVTPECRILLVLLVVVEGRYANRQLILDEHLVEVH
jgi:hypothetical protein